MKTYRSFSSAAAAYNRFQSAYGRLTRRLHRIAVADACPGDMFVGWDMPTLRICRPDDYAELVRLDNLAHQAQVQVRWFSFVPAPVMEFA